MAGSRLIKDLAHVPEIIASLGLSIADAQHALNVEYLDALNRIIAMSRSLLGDPNLTNADARTFLETMLEQLAPARYQFTETTLTVRLNLAQRLDVAGQVGLGVGTGAVAVNAGFALAYGFDYRATAECRTVLHAHSADTNVMDKLLARAKDLAAAAVELPPLHQHEKALTDAATEIFTKMVWLARIPKDAEDSRVPLHELTVRVQPPLPAPIADWLMEFLQAGGKRQAAMIKPEETPARQE